MYLSYCANADTDIGVDFAIYNSFLRIIHKQCLNSGDDSLLCELRIGCSSVAAVSWFNTSRVRPHRPGGDESSSGKEQDPSDPSDDGLLQFTCCYHVVLK